MQPSSGSLSLAALTSLADAASAINSTLELDGVLKTISRCAGMVLHAEAATVFLLDQRRGKLCVAAATGRRAEVLSGQEFDADVGVPGEVVRTGEPVLIRDVRSSAKFRREIDDIGTFPTSALVAAPMIHRSEVIGVIEVVNRFDERPFDDTDLLVLKILTTFATSATQNARAHTDLQRRFEGLRDSVMRRDAIIGESPSVQRMLELCRKVAPSNATVLITGETGTGKELTARYIHNLSRRRDETFIAINCAALPETLLESELFGHEKGSFTGAHAQRRGWFELADRGTLFLDEIGEISRAIQAKLLRLLQEKEFVRVGGSRSITCDVRIIAATNRDLKTMVGDGVFREDLFYRLSVFPLQLPALRERGDDIPRLVEHFLACTTKELQIPELRVSPAALDILQRYAWPGNIRELQNVIERSALMSEGDVLQPCHLPIDIVDNVRANGSTGDDASTLHGQERLTIRAALEKHNWNQSETARSLGISRDLLRHRVKKYGLQKPADSDATA